MTILEMTMKLDTIKSDCKEVFVEGAGISVTVHTWGNCEGCSLMVHGKGPDMPLRMAGAFRWEEIDVILVALTAAHSQ